MMYRFVAEEWAEEWEKRDPRNPDETRQWLRRLAQIYAQAKDDSIRRSCIQLQLEILTDQTLLVFPDNNLLKPVYDLILALAGLDGIGPRPDLLTPTWQRGTTPLREIDFRGVLAAALETLHTAEKPRLSLEKAEGMIIRWLKPSVVTAGQIIKWRERYQGENAAAHHGAAVYRRHIDPGSSPLPAYAGGEPLTGDAYARRLVELARQLKR
jgi:hypothetical protein